MKQREIKLKPRNEATLPPEKLMETLNEIYSPKVAEELFHDFQERYVSKCEKTHGNREKTV